MPSARRRPRSGASSAANFQQSSAAFTGNHAMGSSSTGIRIDAGAPQRKRVGVVTTDAQADDEWPHMAHRQTIFVARHRRQYRLNDGGKKRQSICPDRRLRARARMCDRLNHAE